MAKRHDTLYIQPFPPHYKGKILQHYEVRIGHKKPMKIFPTLAEAAEFAFKYTDKLHVPRVKHTLPDPKNHSHWVKLTEADKEKLKELEKAEKRPHA